MITGRTLSFAVLRPNCRDINTESRSANNYSYQMESSTVIIEVGFGLSSVELRGRGLSTGRGLMEGAFQDEAGDSLESVDCDY
jgi:hypothetical protein